MSSQHDQGEKPEKNPLKGPEFTLLSPVIPDLSIVNDKTALTTASSLDLLES